VQRAVVYALGALVVCVTVAGNASAQGKCQALKFKAAGTVARVKAACHARAAKQGAAVDPDCLAAAEQKLTRRWATAEAAGDCVTIGDLSEASSATEQCRAAIADVLAPPPPPTSLCCDLGASCIHGIDSAAYTGVFGGTVGPAGSVCDGGTGACGAPPATAGRCCMMANGEFCNAGPDLDLSGCIPPQFLDFVVGICTPSGACALP